MDISGKVLREVEFRDRLRGYDTDEVDEFLEKVAVGVDDLQREVTAANARAERAERQFESIPPVDDDSLRRTLVLAQRTADLAISEAREEASHLLEQARSQSDALMSEARQAAQALRNEAERDMKSRVQHLSEEHDRLTREVAGLATLVDGERSRITESLNSLLEYVAETLKVAPNVADAVKSSAAEPRETFNAPSSPSYESDAGAPGRGEHAAGSDNALFDRGFKRDDDPLDLRLPDVEAEIGEDAAIAFGGASRELAPESSAPAELDPDEELWSRWANSAEPDDSRKDVPGEPSRLGRRAEGDNPS